MSLAQSPSPRPRSRRLPAGLLGMLALVAGAERIIAAHERAEFMTTIAASWEQAFRATRREAKGSDLLLFGDSMVKFGLAPKVIEERSGLKAYNLAVYGGPPAASFALLRRALDAGIRPRAVVVDFMPNLIGLPPQSFLRPLQTATEAREWLDLARSAGEPSFFVALAAGRLPSARARGELRAAIGYAFQGLSNRAATAHYVAPLWRNWRLNRGNQLLAPDPKFDGAANPADKSLFPDAWTPNPAQARYVRRFLDLARDRGLVVYWLLPPMCPATQELREQTGNDAFLTRLAGSIASKYPNVILVDARHAGLGKDVFTDPVHVDRHGTFLLSRALGDAIRRGPPPGERRLTLAPSAGPVPEYPHEDVDQSRIAQKDGRRGRK